MAFLPRRTALTALLVSLALASATATRDRAAHAAPVLPVVGAVTVPDAQAGDRDPDAVRARFEIVRRLEARGVARALTSPARLDLLAVPLPPDAGAFLIDVAGAALREARDAATRFDEAAAGQARLRAEIALVRALPAPRATALLAELHLLAGVARALAGEPAEARAAFTLVRALAPGTTALDPAVYRPDVVALFAATPAGAPAKLTAATEPTGGAIWLDGVEVGAAPLARDVPPGLHYVTATHAGHEPRTERVELAAGATLERQLVLARATPEAQAIELRRALAGGPDLRATAAALAELAAVDLLVLTRSGPRGVEATLYDARTRRLSAWGPAAAVMPLAPPPVTDAPDGRRGPLPEPERPGRPWYRSGWRVGALVGAVALVTAATIWATAGAGTTRYCFGPGADACP